MPDTLIQLTKRKERFLLVESSQIPLTPVPFDEIKHTVIDPTTGKPYQGIFLQGCFADLSNSSANNNMRFYDVPRYLQLLQMLKKQIHSPKGVYGELEHPKQYGVDSNNVSHKIIDVWFDESDKKVYGIVLLMNTPKGLIAQEFIKTGGQLAISARAAGEENENPDGTKNCIVKLMTTFDLVYHPGFSSAILDFVMLNESQIFLNEIGRNKRGFSGIIYERELKELPTRFATFKSLNESAESCFYEWLFESSELNEKMTDQEKSENKTVKKAEKEKNKSEEKVLEKNESSDQEEIQNKLKKAADKDLSETYFNQIKFSQKQLKRKINNKSDQGKSFYDNSAGFIMNEEENPYSDSRIVS